VREYIESLGDMLARAEALKAPGRLVVEVIDLVIYSPKRYGASAE
jgi:hypothetical protein